MSLSVSARRIPYFAATSILVLGIAFAVLPAFSAHATEITSRALTLSSSNPAASNATTQYKFTFTVASATAIKSVGIQICTLADGASCIAPTGFSNNVTGGTPAAFDSQPVGLGAASGWTLSTTPPASNDLYISDASNATPPSGSQTITIDNVQNPTTANQTFFAWIDTYSNANWTGNIDHGVVAASTTQLIILTGTMPESLVFCTGGTVNAACTTTTSGNVTFNQDFSPTATAWATSQMSASTNALHGYAIAVTGPALASGTTGKIYGTNAGGAESDSAEIGTSVFGMNIVADSDTPTLTPTMPDSASVTPASDATNYFGLAHGNYATANEFAFNDTTFSSSATNALAGSDDGSPGSPQPTDGQVYTSTYMVDVAARQPAGTYTTTLTYICTPTF